MNIAQVDPLTLPSLPLGERAQLPNCPAIYFVLAGERILYIGKTLNLAQRWSAHNKLKQFAELGGDIHVAWLECTDTNLLSKIENALIGYFQPVLNRTSGSTKRDDPNYAQVSGYIPKDKALKFKVACTALQITQSDALDEAISLWLEKQESLSSFMDKEDKESA